MTNAVIVDYMRSPFSTANKGQLIKVRADEMAMQVVKALVARTGVNPQDIEDLLLGCSFPEGEQGLNLAKLVALYAGLPFCVAGATINRFCGSSMQAVHTAVGAIACGAGDVFVCAGVESMTRVPMGGFNPMPNPNLYAQMPGAYVPMGETAENLAKRYQLSRQVQDAFAVESHKKALAAQEAGHFTQEIVPIIMKGETVAQADTCIRPGTTLEGLAGLAPAFEEGGSVTAGTSSPLTDGACALLVCSEPYAQTHGMRPMARIKSVAVAGCDPEVMGIGPVEATKKALARAGLTIKDIDVIELNEAFASQSLACIRDLNMDEKKINLDGGAIALGHPLGATGARIVGKAASLLQREGKKYALATQCIGGGQGIATIVEAI
jgi:acetyl-CoA acyltransferase